MEYTAEPTVTTGMTFPQNVRTAVKSRYSLQIVFKLTLFLISKKAFSLISFFSFFREMDGIYREYSIGIDIITSDQALELVNPTVVKVLREMWSDNEGICIAGGDVHTTFTIYFFYKQYHSQVL